MSSEHDDAGGRVSDQFDGNGGEPGETASLDTVFSILAHRHRRYVIDGLLEHYTMPLRAVAEAVAIREHGTPSDEIPERAVKEIYLRLHHVHLPKLEAAGMATYDQSQESVTAGDDIGRAVPFLALVEEDAIEAV